MTWYIAGCVFIFVVGLVLMAAMMIGNGLRSGPENTGIFSWSLLIPAGLIVVGPVLCGVGLQMRKQRRGNADDQR